MIGPYIILDKRVLCAHRCFVWQFGEDSALLLPVQRSVEVAKSQKFQHCEKIEARVRTTAGTKGCSDNLSSGGMVSMEQSFSLKI